jgi:peroxiredoxin
VCARLEPFTLNQCDGTPWSLAGDDFFENNVTLLIISAGWCVPCQREAQVLMREVVEPYRDRGVRVVTIMVQDPNRTAITPAFCNTWRTRYNLDIPVLMDPQQQLSPFYPGLAFPGNLIVDRQGRIRWRQYGTEMSLSAIKAAVDEVLAEPNVCRP